VTKIYIGGIIMKKTIKKIIVLSTLSVIAIPSILAHATPPARVPVKYTTCAHRYEDYLSVSSYKTYAWADTYDDSAVATVLTFADPSSGGWASDSGRYWAESVSYNSNYTGDSRSEAHLAEPTNYDGTAWHRKTMPMGEDFYHARI
jgi:hypothetical protein